MNPFLLSSYHYELPEELIAQHPVTPRDSSRLLIVDRQKERLEEVPFGELKHLLSKGDRLIFNDTRVIPARLYGVRVSGGKAEVLLLRQLATQEWEVLVKPGKKLPPGQKIIFSDSFICTVMADQEDGSKIVRLEWEGDFDSVLSQHGQLPLPPYIKREFRDAKDLERYQTVYAKNSGAAAAPTAGLHFSNQLLETIQEKGVHSDYVTLHVGKDTFRPVRVEDVREHRMHAEWFEITAETASSINNRDKNKRCICVGTTSCRVLESAADSFGEIKAEKRDTSIFIYPGYSFKFTPSLLTNFHLPGSTLLMLVSAFAGYELTMEAYKKAVKDRFRFFSYGDAMLIL